MTTSARVVDFVFTQQAEAVMTQWEMTALGETVCMRLNCLI